MCRVRIGWLAVLVKVSSQLGLWRIFIFNIIFIEGGPDTVLLEVEDTPAPPLTRGDLVDYQVRYDIITVHPEGNQNHIFCLFFPVIRV